MANTKYPQLQSFTLFSSGVTIGDTSIILPTMKTIDGVDLAMSDFGDKGFMTLDPGAGDLEEQISFTGLTQNSNNTTTISGVHTVLCTSPYTETSGVAKQHSGGSTAVVAITSGLLNQFANKGNAETVTGAWTFPAADGTRPVGSSDTDTAVLEAYVTFGQLGRTSFSGTVNASTIVKGIVEEATVAEQGTAAATGGTGARLFVANANLVKTSSGAGDENKIAILNAAGVFANGFLDGARTWGTVQSFTANNCQITTDADSANDAVRSSYLDTKIATVVSTNIPQGAISGTSGEAITAGQGVYLKASDGKLWKTLGSGDESTFSFRGIALTTVGAADLAVTYAPPGHTVTGLTGLTVGPNYITDVAGTLTTTPGTRFARVGFARSTTIMDVETPKFIRTGSFTFVNTDASPLATQTTGFYPAKVSFRVTASGGATFSVGDQASCIGYIVGAAPVTSSQTAAWYVGVNGVGTSTGGVGARTATGFAPTHTTTGNIGTVTVQWTAESF